MTNSKNVLAPILAALLVGTLAGAQAQNRAAAASTPGTQAQQQPQQRFERLARGPLTVKYYNGNPLQGGKLVSTATVQPQPGANPFANAPKGATHVAVSTPFGTRVTTVQDAQARPFGGRRGGLGGDFRGGRGGGQNNLNGQDGHGAPPAGASQATPGQGGRTSRGGNGLGLPGLRGASSVTFYAADPLGGGKAQSTVKLSGAPTAQQRQALAQAAAKAKFAVVERAGETMIVNLSALPGVLGAGR